MNAIAEWLATEEGLHWALHHFYDATEFHPLIEIIDEDCYTGDHPDLPAQTIFDHLRERPPWQDLTWTPDEPP